eukprot:CAMPEP_0184305914 /NCGR_PEP_ID=MMETSP1049-20130417/15056_1 /TAXON_ID=77928 /ORGANISM="Proteomonas sulcata, Strain CCMP704" /LENGTH=184 /DNA_ID=CAMNT_0026618069 /DNA_START=158 /DNA_END=712 /DNA_ORIENTATION=+
MVGQARSQRPRVLVYPNTPGNMNYADLQKVLNQLVEAQQAGRGINANPNRKFDISVLRDATECKQYFQDQKIVKKKMQQKLAAQEQAQNAAAGRSIASVLSGDPGDGRVLDPDAGVDTLTLRSYTVPDVCKALEILGLHGYIDKFRENSIDGSLLEELEDLWDDLGVHHKAHRIKILKYFGLRN